MRLDVDQRQQTTSDSGGGDVESLSEAVQRELERDSVVEALLNEDDDDDVTN